MDGFTDEFVGCRLEDIALAVGYSDPGSEDHSRALDALLRRLPAQAGHNQPPLSEVLAEELEPFRQRRDALILAADTATITDEDSAAKVVDLGQMCKAFETEIDSRRKALIEPHRAATKAINDAHNRLRLDVQVARQGMTGIDGLRGMLTAWREKKQAEAAAKRQAAEREQKEKEAAAAEALRTAEQRQGARGAASAQLNALRAADEAEAARAKAEAVTAAPTRGHLGQVGTKREIRFEITDCMAFAAWANDVAGLKPVFREMLEVICGLYLHSLGVERVGAGVDIPGVAARIEQGAAIIRR